MRHVITRRRWLLTAAMTGCSMTLAACGGGDSGGNGPVPAGGNTAGGAPTPSGDSGGKEYSLGSTIPTFTHPFFVAMKKGLEEEAATLGAKINVVDGQDSAQRQITAMENFVVQKVDAIILCPTETETLPPGVQKANQANIPVITVNRTVASGDVVTYVGADDVEGGRLQGKAVMEAFPKGAKILLLRGVMGSSPQRDREAGLEEALKGHPEFKIIDRVVYGFQRAEGVKVMNTALLKYGKGDIDVVVAQSDDGALAAADVCGQKNRTEIKIIGFNGESDAFDAINAGKIHATILQDAETQGREAVRATIKHLKGEKVENPQITPLHLITKSNIAEFKPAWQSGS